MRIPYTSADLPPVCHQKIFKIMLRCFYLLFACPLVYARIPGAFDEASLRQKSREYPMWHCPVQGKRDWEIALRNVTVSVTEADSRSQAQEPPRIYGSFNFANVAHESNYENVTVYVSSGMPQWG